MDVGTWEEQEEGRTRARFMGRNYKAKRQLLYYAVSGWQSKQGETRSGKVFFPNFPLEIL